MARPPGRVGPEYAERMGAKTQPLMNQPLECLENGSHTPDYEGCPQ